MNYLNLFNFKVFNKAEEFDLAPITFLTGKNNSGKSSVLKSILLLSDFLNSENDQTILNFNGAFSSKHKINCFGNAKTWKSKEKFFSIQFEHNNFRFEFSFRGQENDDTAILDMFCIEALDIKERLSLKWLSEKSYELMLSQRFFDFIARPQQMNLFNEEDLLKQVDEIKAQIKKLDDEKKKNEKNKNVIIEIISEKQRLKTRLKLLTEQIKAESTNPLKIQHVYQTTILIEDEDYGNLSLASIIRRGLSKYFDKGASFNSSDNEYRSLFRFYDILRMRLNLFAEHLSPNRYYQSRLYFKQNYVSEINEVLFRYAIDKPKASSQAARFLEKWLKEFGFGEGIKVEIIEGNSCKVEIIKNGNQINIADMGFGPGQLLTMLLSFADIINKRTSVNRRSRPQIGRNNILLIEEPEANLHPLFQSKLMELFFQVYKDYGLSIIIETHSEYLIRSTQVKVKELGKDHPFKVYYFDSEKGPFEMKYREDGIFENDFGSGFFDESANLTFELI